MIQYFEFWLAKIFAYLGVASIILILGSAVIAAINFKSWLQGRKCKHLHVREDRACNAICMDCGRNLGFIDNWRRQHKEDGHEYLR